MAIGHVATGRHAPQSTEIVRHCIYISPVYNGDGRPVMGA